MSKALAIELARSNSIQRRENFIADQLQEQGVKPAPGRALYDTVLTPRGWSVRTGRRLNWQIESPTAGIKRLLPGMITDIILECPVAAGPPGGSRLVIDTKFTSMVSTGRYGNAALDSSYVYQIYAYLRSQERSNDPLSLTASGMLLHPSVGEEFDEAVTIQGHRIRFATVDLAAESQVIRNRLMSLALGTLA